MANTETIPKVSQTEQLTVSSQKLEPEKSKANPIKAPKPLPRIRRFIRPGKNGAGVKTQSEEEKKEAMAIEARRTPAKKGTKEELTAILAKIPPAKAKSVEGLVAELIKLAEAERPLSFREQCQQNLSAITPSFASEAVDLIWSKMTPEEKRKLKNNYQKAMYAYSVKMKKYRVKLYELQKTLWPVPKRLRYPSAFKIYRKSVLEEIRKKNDSTKLQGISQTIKETWRSMEKDQKMLYVLLSRKAMEKARHQRRMLWIQSETEKVKAKMATASN